MSKETDIKEFLREIEVFVSYKLRIAHINHEIDHLNEQRITDEGIEEERTEQFKIHAGHIKRDKILVSESWGRMEQTLKRLFGMDKAVTPSSLGEIEFKSELDEAINNCLEKMGVITELLEDIKKANEELK